MWKVITAAVLLSSIAVGAVAAQTYVKPSIRKNGTYVEGHYRSSPNNTKADNYSSSGNVNPYTGNSGTQDPYQQPSYGTGYSSSYGSTYRAPSYGTAQTTTVNPYFRKDGTLVQGYSRSLTKKPKY
jgi:hypothetical protein